MTFAYSEVAAFFVQVANALPVLRVQVTVETTSSIGADVPPQEPASAQFIAL